MTDKPEGIKTIRRKLIRLKNLREEENHLIEDIIHLSKESEAYIDLNDYRVEGQRYLI